MKHPMQAWLSDQRPDRDLPPSRPPSTPDAPPTPLSPDERDALGAKAEYALQVWNDPSSLMQSRSGALKQLAAACDPTTVLRLLEDKARLDCAQSLYHSADFEYRDANGIRAVVLLDMPHGVRIGPDLRAFLDAARQAGTAEGGSTTAAPGGQET